VEDPTVEQDTTLSQGPLSWIFSHYNYCSWRENSSPSALLLRAGQNSDVESLSRFLTESLQEIRSSSQRTVVISFTFDGQDERRRTVAQLSLSLIRQLLEKLPDTPSHVRDFYDTHLVHSTWTEQELWTILRSLLSCSSDHQIICIINAIQEHDARQMWFVEDLALLGDAVERGFKVLIIVEGQCNHLGGLPNRCYEIDLERSELQGGSKDQNSTILDSPILMKPVFKALKGDIDDKFRGARTKTQLGVQTLLQYLEAADIRSTLSEMRNKLQSFPFTEPIDIFAETLKRVPFESRHWARDALIWVSYACRPLKTSELSIALATEGQKISFVSMKDNIPQDITGDLTQAVLVVLKIENGEARLIHHNAKDLLTNPKNQEWYSIDSSVHWELCRRCLSYLLMQELQEATSYLRYDETGGGLYLPQDNECFSFLEYAVKYWPVHYRSAANLSSAEHHFVLDFLEDHKAVRMWSELYWYLEDPIFRQQHNLLTLYPLHISSQFGFTEVVELLSQDRNTDSGIRAEEVNMALRIAARSGHVDVVKHLVQVEKAQHFAIELALLEAAEAGHGDVVLKLAQYADKAYVLEHGMRLLCYVAQSGHLKAVEYLLEILQPVDYVIDSDSDSLTPLHHAASQGQTEVVKALLDSEFAITVKRGPDFVTPLQLAAGKGYPEVVDLLIKFRAVVDAHGPHLLTALHLAAENGNHKILEKLLDANAQVDPRDSLGRTPLHLACLKGLTEVATMLINRDADTNTADGQNNTALHHAAEKGHTSMIQLLMKRKPELGKQNEVGDTALHLALRDRHEDAAHFLVRKCADVEAKFHSDSNELGNDSEENRSGAVSGINIVNESGETPLIIAIKNGLDEIALTIFKVLRAKHEAVGLRRFSEQSVLAMAAEKGNIDIVKALLGSEPSQLSDVGGSGQVESMVTPPKRSVSPPRSSEDEQDTREDDDDVIQALHSACENGHVDVVEELLRAKPTIRVVKNWFSESLYSAVENGHKDVVEVLIEATASAKENDLDEKLEARLLRAARLGHEDIVRFFLDRGVDINSQDDYRNTALQMAAFFDKAKVVRLLLLRKADTERADNSDSTPLSDAAYSNSKESLELLLEAGANTETQNDAGETPLVIAAASGHGEIVEILLRAGADVEAQDSDGETALLRAHSNSRDEIVQTLLRARTHSKAKTEDHTLMQAASDDTRIGVLQLLLKAGTTQEARDAGLLHAASEGHDQVVKLLIEHKANINTGNPESGMETPLHKAAFAGLMKTAKLLLDYGADKDLVRGRHGTPLQTAVVRIEPEIVDLLLKNEADVNKTGGIYFTALQAAAYRDPDGRMVQSLLDAEADMSLAGGRYGTPLHAAAASSSKDVAEKLLERGSPAEMKKTSDIQGRLALHLAAMSDDWDLVKLMMPECSDSDLDRLDGQGRTPLHFAAARGATSVIEEILKRKGESQYDVQDGDGWTPLHWACRQRRLEPVELLVRSEADLDRETARGWTPRHVAVFHGNERMLHSMSFVNQSTTHSSVRSVKEDRDDGDGSVAIDSQIKDDKGEEGENGKLATMLENELPLREGERQYGYSCASCDCVSFFSSFPRLSLPPPLPTHSAVDLRRGVTCLNENG
jgi:ankyrin repeat protein